MALKAEKTLTRAEQKAQRPREILDAAFEEFVEKGYAAARMDDVAARVGVTKGTVYLYFPTKEDLFEAVGNHMLTPFADLRAVIDGMRGPYADRLRDTLLLAYDKLVRDRRMREFLRLTLAEGTRSPGIVDRHHDDFVAPLLDAVSMLVDQGVAAGEFSECPVAKVPHVIISSLIHLAVWHLMFGDRKPLDQDAFIEAHIDLVLRGLLKRG